MAIPKDSFQGDIQDSVVQTWKSYMDSMEEALDKLEQGIREASEMTQICTSEWCEATEHVIDELSDALFSISEPRWASDQDSKRLKQLKRRVHDLYASYRGVSAAAKG